MTKEQQAGRVIVIVVISVLLTAEVMTLTLSLRALLTCILCYFLYQGHAWARWVTLATVGISVVLSLYYFFKSFSPLMLILGFVYLACFVLLFSNQAIAFLDRKKDGSPKP